MAISRFGGRFNAGSFAYGINPFVPPLQVINGPTATGSAALTLAYASLALEDGTVISPLSTNAPITVGGNTVETVTPSAVSASTPLMYGTPQVTATFASLHGNGDQIRSGTAGLQEALNFAGSFKGGGGIVVVDASWVFLGGTQAMLNAATIPANVSIEDMRYGGIQQTVTVTLTNAQILGMEVTPVELLPAPGANSMYLINKATLVNLNTGTAYANGGAITVGYGTTAGTQALSGTIAATFLTSPVVTQVIVLAGALPGSSTGSTYLNQPVYITNATAPFITGTGTLQIQLEYSLLTT